MGIYKYIHVYVQREREPERERGPKGFGAYGLGFRGFGGLGFVGLGLVWGLRGDEREKGRHQNPSKFRKRASKELQ